MRYFHRVFEWDIGNLTCPEKFIKLLLSFSAEVGGTLCKWFYNLLSVEVFLNKSLNAISIRSALHSQFSWSINGSSNMPIFSDAVSAEDDPNEDTGTLYRLIVFNIFSCREMLLFLQLDHVLQYWKANVNYFWTHDSYWCN